MADVGYASPKSKILRVFSSHCGLCRPTCRSGRFVFAHCQSATLVIGKACAIIIVPMTMIAEYDHNCTVVPTSSLAVLESITFSFWSISGAPKEAVLFVARRIGNRRPDSFRLDLFRWDAGALSR